MTIQSNSMQDSGLARLSVRLILEQSNHVVALKRRKKNGGGYGLIGGNISLHESPTDAIIRETAEEVGMVLNKKKLKLVHVQHRIDNIKMVTSVVFYFTYPTEPGILGVKEPHKFKEIVWLPAKKLPLTLSPSLAKGIDSVIKGIPYSEFIQQ